MILTIAIISGIMWALYMLANLLGARDVDSTNMLAYGAIFVLSSWFLSTTVGIIFLCIVVVLSIFAAINIITKL